MAIVVFLASRSDQPGVFYDADGPLRLTMPVMSWRSCLVLSTQEIHLHGEESPRVT